MKRLVICIALACSARKAAAEETVAASKDDQALQAAGLDVEYSIPTGPAFDFLGTSPTQISQPGSLKDLGVAIASGLDKDGKLKAGLAFSVSPATIFAVPSLRRIEVTIGSARGDVSEMEDVPTDAAIGIRWTAIDHGDFWSNREHRAALMTSIKTKCAPAVPGEVGAAVDQTCVANYMKSNLAKAKEAFEDAHWNDYRLEMAAATGWRLPDSNPFASESHFLGHAYWLLVSGKIPGLLEHKFQWTGLVQFDQRHEAQGAAYTEQAKGGIRAYVGWNSFHMYAEGLFKFRWQPDSAMSDERDWDWGVGGEIKIRDGNWLVLGLGNALDDESDVQVFANIKWAVIDAAKFSR